MSDSKTIEEISKGLPPLVRDELDEYEEQIKQFKAGQMGEIKFQKIRLQLGTYHQRQDGYQMQRIKVPYGGLTSAQLARLADVADKYASGFIHLTTRQDVQIYYLDILNAPNMMRELADAGITTREACGNTVRNVTACHISGVSPSETFDVTPYAEAFKEFLLRNPICQNMGRKFKVCFEGCQDKDHAGVRIHDLGFRARVKEINGELKRGFQVYIGGGLGASPSLGHLWTDFLPVEELLPFSASVIRIFDRHGERKVRMKARMKFLVRKLGFEKFKELVEEERANLKVDPKWNGYLGNIVEKHEIKPDKTFDFPEAPSGIEDTDEYMEWKKTNVVPHIHDDFVMVNIRVKTGDVPSETARKLARIADIYSDSTIRVSIEQNLVIRWVTVNSLPSLYNALKEIDLALPGADSFQDITACPGADTCRLGITSAKGLAGRLTGMMNNGLGKYRESMKDLRIKISGCPNACAQHVSASIGFQGASITKDGRSVPSEMLFVGGGLYGDDTRFATPITKIPTRNAPKVVKKLLETYESEKQGEESFDEVMERLGSKHIKDLVEEFKEIPSYEDDPDFYTDWGHEEDEFEIQKGVKGECAGATVEEKVPTFLDAEKRLEQAQAHFLHGDYESSINETFVACSDSAHVPLYTKLVDPFTPEQTIWEFENLLVRTGEADQKWLNVLEQFKKFKEGEPTAESAIQFLETAKQFNSDCVKIQEQLISGENSK